MRPTYVNVTIHGKHTKQIKMLVNTGSTYIVLPPQTIEKLGLIKTPYTIELTPAHKRKIKAKLHLAQAEIKGRKGPALIAEADTPVPLLGAHALETLGFKANPLTGQLEEISPEGGYLLYTTNKNQ